MTVAALSVCLSSLLLAPQDPPTSEVFSLQHLVAPLPAATVPPWGSMLRRPADEPRIDLVGCESPGAAFGPEDIAEMLRELMSQAIENNQLQLNANGQSLFATGKPSDLAQVAERLRGAAPLVARPLQVEFAVWDAADRETPPTVLGPAEFQRFTGNRDPMWRCVGTTRHGVAIALERVRWSRYVRDVDVEVAQKQTMTNPTTDAYGDGGHVVVRPFALVGADEFALHVQFTVAQRRGVVRTLPTGVVDAAELELPTLETDYGAFSGRVPNGGALATTLRGNASCGGARILTARVLARTPPANPIQGNFAIFPCAAMTTTGLTRHVLPREPGGPAPEEQEPALGFGHVHADQLLEMLRQHLGAESESTSMRQGAGYLFVRAETAVLGRCEVLLRSLQNRLVRGVSLHHTASLKVPDGENPATTPLLHELTLPTLVGREVIAARYLETNVVSDVLSAIAQEAGVLDPQVSTLQCGSYLVARVAPFDDAMHLRFMLDNRHALPPQVRGVMPGGVLMPAEVARTIVHHDGVVGNGTPIDHGDGPSITADGRTWRSVMTTALKF